MINELDSSFKFISKRNIETFLNDEWSEEGSAKNSQNDTSLLLNQIGSLLGIENSIVLKELEGANLKAWAQLTGVVGYGTQAKSFPQKPTRIYDEKTNAKKLINTLDLEHDKVVNFSYWKQPACILYFLYFLIEYHFNFSNNLIRQKDVSLKASDLLTILANEIWIAANAYRIRTTYENILNRNEKDGDEEIIKKELEAFINSLLTCIMGAAETEYEFCFPCGSAKHAIYLYLIYDKEKDNLIVRVDNSMEVKPIVFKILPLKKEANFKEISDYLCEVCCQLKNTNTASALDMIHDKNKRYKQLIVLDETDYPPLKKQTTEANCVVEGFLRGIWYRLYKAKNSTDDELFQWVFREALRFSAMFPISTQDLCERQFGEKIYKMQCEKREAMYQSMTSERNELLVEIIENHAKHNVNLSKPIRLKEYIEKEKITFPFNIEHIYSFKFGEYRFDNKNLKKADLSYLDFEKVSFFKTKLKDVNFEKTKLNGATISFSTGLNSIKLSEAEFEDLIVDKGDKFNREVRAASLRIKELNKNIETLEKTEKENTKIMDLIEKDSKKDDIKKCSIS